MTFINSEDLIFKLCFFDQDSFTNSIAKTTHDSTSSKNNHHDRLKEFSYIFGQAKKKVFLRSESEDEISYLCKSFKWNKHIRNTAPGNLQAGDHHKNGNQTVIVITYWNLIYF